MKQRILAWAAAAALLLGLCGCHTEPAGSDGSSGTSDSSASGTPTSGSQPEGSIDLSGIERVTTAELPQTDMRTAMTAVRQRDTADNTRMVINTQNPLFTFFAGLSGESYANFPSIGDMKRMWEAIPEDIRAFSAVIMGYNCLEFNRDDRASIYAQADAYLTELDKTDIKVIWAVEMWDTYQTPERWTVEELSSMLRRHPSLVGLEHGEQSCMGVDPEEIERMKITLRACQENNALFFWHEMEYKFSTTTIYRFMEDRELYDLMRSYAHNVVIIDKHNGQGRHFSSQSCTFGAWLEGLCDNWGTNPESWLFWEEGIRGYDDPGEGIRTVTGGDFLYPCSLWGIDTVADLIGGATVFSFETSAAVYHTVTNSAGEYEVEWEAAWDEILCPLYRRILAENVIPTREEVRQQVHAAYQVTDLEAPEITGIEATLLMDLYGGTSAYIRAYENMGVSKKWIPISGRYYIIPFLSKYADAAAVLPGAEILTAENYESRIGTPEAKQELFRSLYPETYRGDAVVFHEKGLWYLFNSSEFFTGTETAELTLENGRRLYTSMRENTLGIVEVSDRTVEIELTNYRYDIRKYFDKKERIEVFLKELWNGGKRDNPEDFRETVYVLSGYTSEPTVSITGSNHAQAGTDYNAETGTLTVKVISNGVVRITVTE